MKKLLILILVCVLINLILLTYSLLIVRSSFSKNDYTNTTIDYSKIDSVDVLISKLDSKVYIIRNNKIEAINEANSLNDSDAYALFKQLLSE